MARTGGRLLEIGCGRGQVLASLAPHYDEVVGTELSPVRAERARRELAHLSNCRILEGPLESLIETSDPPYDCIIWGDVLEHIIDVIGAMQILARLSRPGTQLVTVTPNISFLPQRLGLLFGRAPTTAYPNEGFAEDPTQTILFDLGHLHYFTFRQVEILYRIAGFRPERRLGIGKPFGPLRNLWPTLLSGLICVSGTFQGAKS
jgi:SAM-dependent methyltransferase